MRRAIHAIVVAVVGLLFVLTPRLARAGGTPYLAKDGGELPLERTDVERSTSPARSSRRR